MAPQKINQSNYTGEKPVNKRGFITPHIQAYSAKTKSLVDATKLRFKQEKNKINNENIVYYVVGGTLILVLIIYLIPIIFGYFSKQKIEKVKIVTSQSTNIIYNNAPVSQSVIPSKTNVSNAPKTKITKVGSRDEMIQIFQKSLNENKLDNLVDYIEPGAKLYLWNGACCRDRDVSTEYVVSTIKSSNQTNASWNFDQDQIDIKRIRDIDNVFRDTYAVVSPKGMLLAVKFAASNKISEVDIVVSVSDAYEATKPQDPNIIYNAQNSQ